MDSGFLDESAAHKTPEEIFDEQCPFYLAIGMSLAEYWTCDPVLARYYREAYKLKQEQSDSAAWLQGLYFYEALNVALANAFRKQGAPAMHYTAHPYLAKKKEAEPVISENPEEKPDKFVLWMNHIVESTKKSAHPE